MIFKKRPFSKIFFLALFCCLHFFAFQKAAAAQTLSGARLSDALGERLKKAGFEPQKKPLSSAWFSEFPYNIEVDFAAQDQSDWTVVLTIAQEDAWAREKFVGGLLERLKGSFIPCNLRILFTACDKPRLSGNEKMSGSEIFCKGVEGAQNVAALVLDFGGKKNFVTPGSDKNVSPYYLARLLCDSLDNNSCPYEISGGIFLALCRLGALKNSPRLSAFLDKNIPAVMLTLAPGEEEQGAQLNSLKDFFLTIDGQKCSVWSRHYIPLKIFSKRRWIEENGILLSVFVFTTAALFILADFAFLFRRRSRRLAQIKMRAFLSNYLIIVTAAILTLSYLLGQSVALGFESLGARNPLLLLIIKLAPAFFIVSAIYPIELLRHRKISTYLYEYIISTSAILNIFLWTFIDISFFYLFAIEYVILALSRLFKRSGFLFFFTTLFIIPFLPLLHSIMIYSNGARVHNLIFCGIKENILLSFTLVPFNLLWLRILARMNIKAATLKNLFFRYIASGFCAIAVMTIFSVVTIHVMGRLFFKNVVPEKRAAAILDAKENVLSSVVVYDTEYYGGKIRRVEITCSENPERCEIYVNGSAANPVYFSVYENESFGRITRFLLPDKPPKKFSVQYSPDPSASEIVVMNYFPHTTPAGENDGRDFFLRENFSFDADINGNIIERRKEK